MAYKDIIVFLDPTADTAARVHLALQMAEVHGARLFGVDVTLPAAFEGIWRDAARDLERAFRDKLTGANLRGEYFAANAQSRDWRDFYTHYCDLVIAPQAVADGVAPEFLIEEIMLSAGVPALVLPTGWRSGPIGDSVVVAWNSSRESTRAVHDSMPILMRAKRVTLFAFEPQINGVESAPDLIQDHLEMHGVYCDVYTWPRGDTIRPADALFACVDNRKADLIVAGAYGHSRLTERIFGGVSDALLHNPTMPVFMAH